MPAKAHVIKLSDVEREELQSIVKCGSHKARTIRRAQTLLWSDAGKTDETIAALHGVTPLTVAKTRQRWVESHSLDRLHEVVTWWVEQRNTQRAKINWCFDVTNARTKLSRLYPSLETNVV